MKSVMEYLDCDNLTIQSRKEAVELRITKFSDINNKIIPFFKEYPIIGVKSQDFGGGLMSSGLNN